MAKKRSKKETLDDLKFEEALADLDRIVAELETGETGLDQTLARYERGVGLLRHCHGLLQKAERRIELLSGVDTEGNPTTTPLEPGSPHAKQKTPGRSATSKGGAGDTTPATGYDDPDMDSPERLF